MLMMAAASATAAGAAAPLLSGRLNIQAMIARGKRQPRWRGRRPARLLPTNHIPPSSARSTNTTAFVDEEIKEGGEEMEQREEGMTAEAADARPETRVAR